MTIPKGWNFNSMTQPKKFCIILNGTFQSTYGKPAEKYSGTETAGNNFDIKKLILGDQVTMEGRKAVAQMEYDHMKSLMTS